MSCDYELLTSLSPQEHPFNDVYLLYKFDISSFFVIGDIWIFKFVILLTLTSFNLIFILLTLGKSILTQSVFFTVLDRSQSFFCIWVRTYCKKQSNPPFDKNSRHTHKIWHKSFSMIQSVKSRTGFLIE